MDHWGVCGATAIVREALAIMKSASTALFLAIAALTACTVNGKQYSPFSGSTTPAAQTAAVPEAGDEPQAKAAPAQQASGASNEQVIDAYLTTLSSFSMGDCARDCDATFRKRLPVKLHHYDRASNNRYYYNPRQIMTANPDPTWLPKWDALPGQNNSIQRDYAIAAMLRAKFHKEWTDSCHKAYEPLEAKWRRAETDMQAAIAKARQHSGYKNITELLALRTPIEAKTLKYEGRTEAYAGARYHLEVALHKAFADAGKEYVYHKQGLAIASWKSLRPLLAPDDERAPFCEAAVLRRADTHKGFPNYGHNFDKIEAHVRPLVDGKQLERIRAQHSDTQEGLRAAFVPGKRFNYSKFPIDKPSFGSLGNQGLEVRSFKRAGDTVDVTYSSTRKRSAMYACRSTNKLERIDSSGKLIYAQKCKTRTVTDTVVRRFIIPADAIPGGLSLKKGDTFSGYGDSKVEKQQSKTRTHTSYVYKVDFITTIVRDGKTLGAFFK